ncbi:MAG TPA: DUF2306 domain-containing protein [Pilimelia sp.]|nr:DUF2306 domain-containing protein [Pilimelia sp.]
MTILIKDSSDAGPDRGGPTGKPVRRAPGRPARRWWRHPWLGVLTVVVIGWLLMFVVPTYVSLDQSKSRVEVRPDVWFHYPVLIVHIATSMVALLAGCLQMSSRLRRHRPRAHRITGRVYLFGGVLPGAIAAATLIGINLQGSPRDAGLSIAIGNSMWAVLWFGTGIRGLMYARQRRFADHRRLMIYSFALTMAILWTRPFAVAAFTIPGFDMKWFVENVGWIPWVVNLLIAQWWLNRTARRPIELPASARNAAEENDAVSAAGVHQGR